MHNPHADLQQSMHQWGARAVPFQNARDARIIETPGTHQAMELLHQMAALRSVMLLSGTNGVGKSALVAHWVQTLEPKRFKPMVVTQATLSASGLLATLLAKIGQEPAGRRYANLARMEQAIERLGAIIPVIILDEAQNYTASAIEEVRLLLGLNLPALPSFALILVGDDYLLDTLRLQSRRALYTRIATHYRLAPLEPVDAEAFVNQQLARVGIERQVFEPAAMQLLCAAADGIPRTLNLLARAAWLQASKEQVSSITPQHVQAALERVPAARDKIHGQHTP